MSKKVLVISFVLVLTVKDVRPHLERETVTRLINRDSVCRAAPSKAIGSAKCL